METGVAHRKVGAKKGGVDARVRVANWRVDLEQVRQQFGEIYAELYPLKPVNAKGLEVGAEPQRATPYASEPWQTDEQSVRGILQADPHACARVVQARLRPVSTDPERAGRIISLSCTTFTETMPSSTKRATRRGARRSCAKRRS